MSGSTPAGRGPHRLAEALDLVEDALAGVRVGQRELAAVDDGGGAQLADQLDLVVGGDNGDGVGPEQRAQLHRERAQPAAGAPHQHVVAGLDAGLVDQHPVGGEVGEPVAGRLLPGQLRRLGQQLLGLHLAVLGEAAPVGLVGPDLLLGAGHRVEPVALGALAAALVAVDHDLVAGLPAGHARADALDDARRVGAGDVEVVAGVAEDRDGQPQRRPHAVVVDAGGHHPHQHLARARLRHLDLLELHGMLGIAQPLRPDHPRPHHRRPRHRGILPVDSRAARRHVPRCGGRGPVCGAARRRP